MTFNHFIKRHTKLVLVFIGVTMVLPLVLWGQYGQGTSDPDDDKVAGTFRNAVGEQITVTRRAYLQQRRKAVAEYWWRQLQRNPYAFFGRRTAPPDKELHKITWDRIILLEDARVHGVTASPAEYAQTVNQIFSFATRFSRQRVPFSESALYQIGQSHFSTPKPVFEGWLKDLAVSEKLLALVTEGAFAEYGQVFEEVSRESQEARVWYAAFDPDAYLPQVRPVGAEEVAARYERDRSKYQVADKVQVSYLMADLEKRLAKVADPSDEDVKKYYAEYKDEFLKPHEHAPGEVHQEDEAPEYRPLEDVRDEIVKKWKEKQAQDEAQKVMRGVNEDLGKLWDAEKKSYPADAFGKLKAQYASRKIELIHDVTEYFGRDDVEEVEKTLGENTQLSTWAFAPDALEGRISDGPVTTDKGVILFRMEKKKAGYTPGVTEPVRRRIEKELREEQLKKRAETAAGNLEKSINSRGFAAARKADGIEWDRTGYFKVNGGQTGIEDWSLSSEITRRITGQQLKPGRSATLSGGQSSTPERSGWSYVVYLEDLRPGKPDDFESAFNAARSRLDRQEQSRYREKYPLDVRAKSELEDRYGAEENLVPPASEPKTVPPPAK